MRKLLKALADHWEVVTGIGVVVWALLQGLPALLILGAVCLAILCAVHEWIPWKYLTWIVSPEDRDREYVRRVLVVTHRVFSALVITIPILSISGFLVIRNMPAWTDDRIVEILTDKHLTENLSRDTLNQPFPSCTHKDSHVGLVTSTTVTLFPAEPVFGIVLRPLSAIPGGVASVSSLLLLVVLFVLWMAELVASVTTNRAMGAS